MRSSSVSGSLQVRKTSYTMYLRRSTQRIRQIRRMFPTEKQEKQTNNIGPYEVVECLLRIALKYEYIARIVFERRTHTESFATEIVRKSRTFVALVWFQIYNTHFQCTIYSHTQYMCMIWMSHTTHSMQRRLVNVSWIILPLFSSISYCIRYIRMKRFDRLHT